MGPFRGTPTSVTYWQEADSAFINLCIHPFQDFPQKQLNFLNMISEFPTNYLYLLLLLLQIFPNLGFGKKPLLRSVHLLQPLGSEERQQAPLWGVVLPRCPSWKTLQCRDGTGRQSSKDLVDIQSAKLLGCLDMFGVGF